MSALNEVNAMVKRALFGLFEDSPKDDPMYKGVYSFYRDILPEIRKRELGVDVLPKEEQEAFASIPDVPVRYVKLRDGIAGNWNNWLWDPTMLLRGHANEIWLNPEYKDASTLAHELRHYLQEKIKSRSLDALDNQYKYRGVDIHPNTYAWYDPRHWLPYDEETELETTNVEHQFGIYESLMKQLGREPSAEEFFKKVDEDPVGIYVNERMKPLNRYEEIANDNNKDYVSWESSPQRSALVKRLAEEEVPETADFVTGSEEPSWAKWLAPSQLKELNAFPKGTTLEVMPTKAIEMDMKDRWQKTNPQFQKNVQDFQKSMRERVQNVPTWKTVPITKARV